VLVHRRPSGLLLVPAAVLVVHQARYSLAFGSRTGAALAAQGHSYLHSVVPWTIFALGLSATSFLRRLAHAARTGDTGRVDGLPLAGLWGLTTFGLFAIYCVQETLEGLVASGHPGGVAGVLGHGGWWAVPASAVVALAVVAVLRAGRAAIRFASRLAPRRTYGALPSLALRDAFTRLAPSPLALAAAGRAPPRVRS
jgi:hypothetical protein